MSAISLTILLQYKNQAVIERYERDFPNNALNGEAAFTELMKYFWLANHHKIIRNLDPDNEALNFSCYLFPEMKEIDDIWHSFLLFTKDYMEFCDTYFGEFQHHTPIESDEIASNEEIETHLTRYLSFIYDTLGEQTVQLWFEK
jgi:hypothetical protein